MKQNFDVDVGKSEDISNYEHANEKRRELGEYLIKKYALPVIPLHCYDAGGNKGKIPIIKEWQLRTETSLDEFHKWLDDDAYRNLGLVLGSNSGIVAIDVDSAGGNDILQTLSGGDLPETVCYSTQAQKMFVLLGEGANGKSLLCNIITALCGEKNVSSISLRNLSKQFAKANLVDKLLNVSTENEMIGDSLNTEDIKAISSGDLIQIERKFENPYSVKLYAKLMFSVNRLSYSRDNSYAIIRRLIIIPFNKTFVDNPIGENQGKIDITLEGKILAELNGILNFALVGLQRLQANNYVFTKAQKSADILEEYKLEINPFLDFIQSCIEQTDPNETKPDNKRIEIKSFLEGFKEWCNECNHKKLLDTSLKRFLKESRITLKNLNIPFTEGKSNGSQYFYGITFTEQMKAKIRNSARRKLS